MTGPPGEEMSFDELAATGLEEYGLDGAGLVAKFEGGVAEP